MGYYAVAYSDDYLEHFGVKGMRWGVRRYQNPDGSLTEAGKKKYYYRTDKNTGKSYRRDKKDIRAEMLGQTAKKSKENDHLSIKSRQNRLRVATAASGAVSWGGLAILGAAIKRQKTHPMSKKQIAGTAAVVLGSQLVGEILAVSADRQREALRRSYMKKKNDQGRI